MYPILLHPLILLLLYIHGFVSFDLYKIQEFFLWLIFAGNAIFGVDFTFVNDFLNANNCVCRLTVLIITESFDFNDQHAIS